MECVTCRSPRIKRFVDFFGTNRVFCRNCWVSFPESVANLENPRRDVHINFAAVREADGY